MIFLKPARLFRPGKPTYGNVTFGTPVAGTQANVLSTNTAEVVKNIGNALNTAARG